MKKISNYLKEIGLGWLFKLSVLIDIALLIAGFIVPPMGVIHGSVLIAVGEIGIIINIPVFFAFAHSHDVNVKADLDDRSISVTTNASA